MKTESEAGFIMKRSRRQGTRGGGQLGHGGGVRWLVAYLPTSTRASARLPDLLTLSSTGKSGTIRRELGSGCDGEMGGGLFESTG